MFSSYPKNRLLGLLVSSQRVTGPWRNVSNHPPLWAPHTVTPYLPTQARSLNLAWTCLESFPGLPWGLETWPMAPEARADPQRFLGKTQGPDRQPETTPRVWGMRSVPQEGKSRCFRMETHGGRWRTATWRNWCLDQETMETAREHWTAVLMEKRTRTFLKAWCGQWGKFLMEAGKEWTAIDADGSAC